MPSPRFGPSPCGSHLLAKLVRSLGLVAVFFLIINCSDFAQGQQTDQLPVGFAAADSDSNSLVSGAEFRSYIVARLPDADLDIESVFDRLDSDNNGSLSNEEFENRREVLNEILSDAEGGSSDQPSDPGVDYVPFHGLDQPTDDSKTIGALFHRYEEMRRKRNWPERIRLKKLPRTCRLPKPNLAKAGKSVDGLHRASVMIAGGGTYDFFTGGAVLVSPDGLALTNYHIAEFFNRKLIGMTPDGKAHRVVEFVAGDRAADVALIRLEGNDFPFVNIAETQPSSGDDLHMVHHTDMRFFTYDRGYVKRYPKVRDQPWMEVALPYAPGGSGCGIFNEKFELVGLVSLITMGDGPSIATEDMLSDEEFTGDEADDEAGFSGGEFNPAPMLIRLAVPLSPILKTWNSASKKESEPVSDRDKKNGSKKSSK